MKRFFLTASVLVLAFTGSAWSKDSLTIGIQLEPPHLDPTSAAAGAIDDVTYANIFEGLTRFQEDGSIVPSLAESWTISDDGLTYTFKLHDGVTFHDGTTMDAEDVKFSLDRARGDDSTNAQKGLFSGIAEVNVIDPTTVEVKLSETDGNFLFNMAWGDAAIVAPESIENIKTNPIGTGAFKFSKWVQGDRVELVRNDAYWGQPADLKSATFKFISDPTAAFSAMMAGDLDAFSAFPAPENLIQFEADDRYRVLIGSTEGETILSTNNKKPPFDNVKVRKALAHAINRKELIDGAQFGYGTQIGSHFAPHHPAYVDLTGNSQYDPELAKSLLKEAGLEDGVTVSLKLPPPSYARRGGEIIAAQLRAVGINTEISNLEWAQWLEEVFRGKDFNLTIVSHTEPMDIGIYANPDYYFQYDNADFQALIKELRATTDTDKRNELLKKAQTMISEDYVNGFLFQLPRLSVAKKEIEGIWVNAPTQAVDLTHVRWAE